MNMPKALVAVVAALIAAPAVAAEALQQGVVPPHPRVIISRRQVNRLRVAASSGDIRYTTLRQWADSSLREKAGACLPGDPQSAWCDAAQAYALLYRIEPDDTLKQTFAAEALVYLKALCDDLAEAGDARGGDGIDVDDRLLADRCMALAAAIDWLHDYEALDAGLKARATGRLDAWTARLQASAGDVDGRRVEPWEGRYVRALAARALSAAAALETDPQARGSEIAQAASALKERVLPAYAQRCKGGYCPEGWSAACGYGAAVDAVLTLRNVASEELDASFFAEAVRAVIHSTRPDRRRVYGGPSGGADGLPLPLALMARLSTILDGTDAAEAARYYVLDFPARDEANRLSPLAALLYVDLLAKRTDFTRTEPLSFLAPGAGLVTCRSSWSETAFWTTFQSGAPGTPEPLDYGRVTADYLGANLLLNAPQQYSALFVAPPSIESTGPAGAEIKTLGFEDVGPYAYARADVTGAYAGAAGLVAREFFYLRPATLILIDRIEPLDPNSDRGLMFHLPRAAEAKLGDTSLTVAAGPAVFGIWSILPASPTLALVGDDSQAGGGDASPYALKVSAPVGEPSARFYTVFSAAQADPEGRFLGVKPVVRGQRGAMLQSGRRLLVVFFAEPTDPSIGFAVPLLGGLDMYILGLEPSKRYDVKVVPQGKTLQIMISPSLTGDAASPNGVLQAHLQARPQQPQ